MPESKVTTARPASAQARSRPQPGGESPAQTAALAEAEAITASAAAAAAAEVAAEAVALASAAARVSNNAALQHALDAEEGLGSTMSAATPLDRATAAATAVASSSVAVELAGSYQPAQGATAPRVLSWDGTDAAAIVSSAATTAVAVATITVAVAAAAAAAASAAIDAATLVDGQLGRNVAAGAAAAVARAIADHANDVATVALQTPDDPAAAVAVAAAAAASVARHIAAGPAPAAASRTGAPEPGPAPVATAGSVAPERAPVAPARSGAPEPAPVAPARTEWASMLADPVMPRFTADLYAGPVSFASPAEQGLWRDISLTRRMEVLLRENEADFQVAFRNAPVAMLVVGLPTGRPGHFQRVNPALCVLTGYRQEQLLDLGFDDLAYHGPAVDRPTDPSGRSNSTGIDGIAPPAPAAGSPHDRVCRWIHADGHAFVVRIRTAPVLEESGLVGQLVCQVEDVTDRVAADQALRASEARFRLAFAHAPQAAVLVELTGRPGRLTAANRAAGRMFGRSDLETPWLALESLVDRADRQAIRDLLARLSTGHEWTAEGDFRYRSPGGTDGWFALSAQVLPAADGRPDHALAYLRDRPTG